ncbi:unnamed protein product, partial [Mesorhabditis belari]|uniref:EB domain-containing protein n=1 Tax=Mesorhabditis belari TaxID=2138241 RepID=A0AAF3FKI0_9BILA
MIQFLVFFLISHQFCDSIEFVDDRPPCQPYNRCTKSNECLMGRCLRSGYCLCPIEVDRSNRNLLNRQLQQLPLNSGKLHQLTQIMAIISIFLVA